MYWLRRGWAQLTNEVFVLPSRTLVLVWTTGLLALPFVYGDAYVLRILTMTCIFAIFAASWDLLAGYLCLRLRGSYLSLATLAFPLIALGLLFAFPDFSGGELGISGLRRLMVTPVGNYYVAALSMLAIVFALWLLA